MLGDPAEARVLPGRPPTSGWRSEALGGLSCCAEGLRGNTEPHAGAAQMMYFNAAGWVVPTPWFDALPRHRAAPLQHSPHQSGQFNHRIAPCACNEVETHKMLANTWLQPQQGTCDSLYRCSGGPGSLTEEQRCTSLSRECARLCCDAAATQPCHWMACTRKPLRNFQERQFGTYNTR